MVKNDVMSGGRVDVSAVQLARMSERAKLVILCCVAWWMYIMYLVYMFQGLP